MRRERKKKLTGQDLKAAGLTPQLVTRRVRSEEAKNFGHQADMSDRQTREKEAGGHD